MNKDDVTKTRDKILNATLPHVPFDGWVWEAVIQGAQDAGYDADIVRAIFPAEMLDVLDAFSDMADRAMLEALEGQNPEDMRIRDRVRTALLARFEYLQPHKDAIRQSTSFWMIPTRKPRAAKIIWRTADRIWDWAGDTASDYNHYTKRTLLSAVIISTTLAWLDDASPDMGLTKEFLDRRIENVMQLGKAVGRAKAFKGFGLKDFVKRKAT